MGGAGQFAGVIRELALGLCLTLPACAQPSACRAIGGKPAMVATLLFGLDIAGRRPVTDDEWAAFLREVVTPRFPDGLTVLDGSGQWRDPATGRIAHEPSRVAIIATDNAADLPARLGATAEAYKTRFQQRSVGILLTSGCAAF